MTAQTVEEITTNRLQLVKLVRKYGNVNTDGLLEDTCTSFMIPDLEGFIGYRVENGNAVVFGDPVCSQDDKPTLAEAFQKYCVSQNLGVVYTIISKEFAEWAHAHLSASIVEFGENFIFDPFQSITKNTGSRAVLVRKKVKHALKDGVIVHEYLGNEKKIEQEIDRVASAWIGKRKGPQIYLAHVTLFQDRIGKRWFYAEQNGKVVGLLVLNEIKAKKGWLLNNVMMIPLAPNGVSELLIISALEALEKEDCHYVIAGPVTLKTIGDIKGMNAAVEQLVRLAFKGAKLVFHLDGYEGYWLKFEPKIEGSYLAFPEGNIGYSSVKALVRAYNMNIG